MKNKIYIPLSGGLGNQLFQISEGCRHKEYSEINFVTFDKNFLSSTSFEDLRKLVNLDEIGEVKFEKSYILRKINNAALRFSSLEGESKLRLFLRLIISLLEVMYSISHFRRRRIVVSRNIQDSPLVNDMREEIFLVGYFQNYESSLFIEKFLKFSFTSVGLSSGVLVLQVRRGDYLSESKLGTLSVDYFIRNALILIEKEEIREIWLFTNGPDIYEEISRAIPQINIEWKDEKDTCPSDILLEMSRGNHFLISNSTFGWWGARISSYVESNVTIPSPWFKSIPVDLAALAPHWRRATSFWTE